MSGLMTAGFRKLAGAAAALAGGVCVTSPGVAQEAARQPAGQEDLAKKLANPISDLVSVPFQFNWENKVGPDKDGVRMVLNIQPVVPFSLSPKWNLIARWIMPYIAQPAALGSSSGLGDVVFSTFFSPAAASSLTWGVGPVLTLPMTSDPTLGSGKWSIGPTAVALFKGEGPWVFGALVNQQWSFASASAGRPEVDQAFLQPFIGYITTGGITYTLNSESSANWRATDGQKWTVPIIFHVSKLTKFGPFPFSVQGGLGWYVEKPDGGPDWKLRTSFVILLPRGK